MSFTTVTPNLLDQFSAVTESCITEKPLHEERFFSRDLIPADLNDLQVNLRSWIWLNVLKDQNACLDRHFCSIETRAPDSFQKWGGQKVAHLSTINSLLIVRVTHTPHIERQGGEKTSQSYQDHRKQEH